jgi:hypothetical protein
MKTTCTEVQIKMVEMYIKERKSLKFVSEQFGMSITSVLTALKQRGIKSRSISDACRIHFFDEDYFKIIDSSEKSQILGLIAADGCISMGKYDKKMTISLNIKDINYLDYIRKCLKHPKELAIVMGNGYGKGKKYCKLNVCSQKLFNDLCDKGLSPCKSLTHGFPSFDKVPEEFISSYLLGYFEGDGCICLTKSKDWNRKTIIGIVKICASKPFCEKFKEYVEKTLNISVKIKDSGKSIWYINIDGSCQVETFLDWIYKDAPFVMDRKYQKYLEFKQNRKLVESRREERAELSRQTLKKNNRNRDYSILSEQIKKQRAENPSYNSQLRRAKIQHRNTGEIITIEGVKKFLRENPSYNFKEPSLCGLIAGRLSNYKNYILLEKIN